MRACIELPVTGTDDLISFSTWVSLSKQSFDRFCELLDTPHRSNEGPFFAWVCEPIPTYPDTEPLKAYIHLRNHGVRPYVELEPTDYPLAVEQRNGATDARVQELYAWLERNGSLG